MISVLIVLIVSRFAKKIKTVVILSIILPLLLSALKLSLSPLTNRDMLLISTLISISISLGIGVYSFRKFHPKSGERSKRIVISLYALIFVLFSLTFGVMGYSGYKSYKAVTLHSSYKENDVILNDTEGDLELVISNSEVGPLYKYKSIDTSPLLYSPKLDTMVNPDCPNEDMSGTIRNQIGYDCANR